MQISTSLQWRNANVKSDGSGSKGLTPWHPAVLSLLCAWARHSKTRTAHSKTVSKQEICTSVQPTSAEDCTSGNETRTQNACASVPIHIVSYSYTVIIPCTVLYDVPLNAAYKTLSKYFIQVLLFVTIVYRKLPNSYIKLLKYRHPIVRFL